MLTCSKCGNNFVGTGSTHREFDCGQHFLCRSCVKCKKGKEGKLSCSKCSSPNLSLQQANFNQSSQATMSEGKRKSLRDIPGVHIPRVQSMESSAHGRYRTSGSFYSVTPTARQTMNEMRQRDQGHPIASADEPMETDVSDGLSESYVSAEDVRKELPHEGRPLQIHEQEQAVARIVTLGQEVEQLKTAEMQYKTKIQEQANAIAVLEKAVKVNSDDNRTLIDQRNALMRRNKELEDLESKRSQNYDSKMQHELVKENEELKRKNEDLERENAKLKKENEELKKLLKEKSELQKEDKKANDETRPQIPSEDLESGKQNERESPEMMFQQQGATGFSQEHSSPGYMNETSSSRQKGKGKRKKAKLQNENQSASSFSRSLGGGMPNIGNSCYMNSVLQCLFNIQDFRKYFKSNYYWKDSKSQRGGRGSIVSGLATVFNALESDSVSASHMSSFKSLVNSHDQFFCGSQQQEAHDLLSGILNWMHEELKGKGSNEREISLISELFTGYKETAITCTHCGIDVSNNVEPFKTITLPVNVKHTCQIEDLLLRHFRQQQIDWDCDTCSRTNECLYKTFITHLPKVLIIHFSRFNESSLYGYQDAKARVQFPEYEFSLSKVVGNNVSSPKYNLTSVCEHYGGMGFGHYTAHCKVPGTKDWKHCNDSIVTVSNSARALAGQASHILFYERSST